MAAEKDALTLTLTPEEINLVLEGLGNLPFVKVYALVGKIQSQCSAQLQATPQEPIEHAGEPQ